jgi:ribosomal protein L13E
MAKSTETSSTKSSKLSSTAASLKKKVKSGAKAVARPFKKLKQAISTSASTCSTHSRSSRAFSLSDNEADDSNTKSAADRGSVHGNDSGPEEITPEEELGTYSN